MQGTFTVDGPGKMIITSENGGNFIPGGQITITNGAELEYSFDNSTVNNISLGTADSKVSIFTDEGSIYSNTNFSGNGIVYFQRNGGPSLISIQSGLDTFSGTIEIPESIGIAADTDDAGNTASIQNNGTLRFRAAAGLQTITADISGTGLVNITGEDGETVLDGTNTFSGNLNFNSSGDSTLSGNTTSFPPNGNIIVNDSTSILIFNEPDPGGEYNGTISGEGKVRKEGDGNLTFSLGNTNTFSGGLTVNSGKVIGSVTSIPSAGGVSISNGASLEFNQTVAGTFSGVISGDGSVTKSGNGALTISDINDYNGNTSLNAGSLIIAQTGSIENGTITLANGTTLSGQGSVNTVINNGTGTVRSASLNELQLVMRRARAPFIRGLGTINNFFRVLTVTGDYTQGANGRYVAAIQGDQSSNLAVTGTATLAGTLSLEVGGGVYTPSDVYTVLTANTIDGNFTTVVDNHALDWVANVVGNQIQVSPTGSTVVTTTNLSSLKGDSKVMGDYMFADPNFVLSNPDLNAIANIMVLFPDQPFANALMALSPIACAAIPQTTYQSNLQMAVVLDKQFQKEVRKNRSRHTKKNNSNKLNTSELCYGIPKTGFFIEPIGIYYNQRQTDGPITNQGQVGFYAYTYGAGMGWEQVIDRQFIVEGGLGYTHSNLNWEDHFGNSRWSTLYAAPFFGWFNEKAYGNFMVMGAFNFVRTQRRILFPGLERVAKSHYVSFDVLLRANGGARLEMGNNYWFQPDATLNYLNTFTPNYSESGAGSVSLDVKNNVNYIMQPSFRAKLIKQVETKKFCYAPNIYVGWLANILLKDQTLSARYKEAPNNIFFTINGYSGTTNQLILGGEFYAERFNQFILSSNFEIDMLSKFEVYTVKIKFEWMF